MSHPALSRVQRNDVFERIRRQKLDPADFRWSTEGKNRTKEIIKHLPTEAQIGFEPDGGGWWIGWWPSTNGGRMFVQSFSWSTAVDFLDDWLKAVKADDTAPNLWGEIAKEKTISEASGREAYEEEFTAKELKLLHAGLRDIEEYILATQPLDPAGKEEVSKRFRYLLEAARKGVRKVDWLNIFVGQAVGMVVAGLLDPRVYGPVMAHATTALNAVFQFGLKLLNQ